MAATIECPACRKQYRVDESRYGKKLKCQCGNIFRAQAAPTDAEVKNPSVEIDRFSGSETDQIAESRATSEAPPLNTNEDTFVVPGSPVSGQIGPAFDDDDFKLEPLAQPVRTELPPVLKPSAPTIVAKTANDAAQTSTAKEGSAKPKHSRIYFGIEQTYMFQCGAALVWLGFLGMQLPHMGMQLVILQRTGRTPEQIRVMLIVAMVIGAGLLLFSQGKNFVKGGAMALFSLAVLGLLCLQPDGMDKGANATIAVQQPAMPVPTPQIRQDPIPQYEPPKEFVHHLEQQQPQFQQQPRMDSQPPAEFGRTPSRLRLGQDGAMPEMDHLQRTDKAGGPGGAAYSIVDNQRRPVRGFRWKMSTWFKEPTLAELTPVYEAREAPTSELEAEPFLVMAKEGYAVGGINVIADKFVRGVQVIFMKLDGDRLNPEDKYSSDWIGAETSESTATLTNDGKMVIGVFGGKGAVMDSIGLILDDK